MSAATLRPPEAEGIGRGFAFALAAHGLLILALSYGLHWRSDSSPAFEAELWSSVPQVAAPRAEAPPEPEPEAPKPDTRAQQRAAEEAAAEQQQREAEIAIAKEKKRKEDKAREEAAREKAAKDKAAKEKADREELERKKAKEARDAKEAKEAKLADARREAQRLENLRRIQGMAGGTPDSNGKDAQNAAPSAGWMGQVRAAVRRSVTFDADDAANPVVEIRVFVTPEGRILGRKVIKPSPDPKWDEAALRGIDKLGSVPRDGTKRLPDYLDLPMRPKDEVNPR